MVHHNVLADRQTQTCTTIGSLSTARSNHTMTITEYYPLPPDDLKRVG